MTDDDKKGGVPAATSVPHDVNRSQGTEAAAKAANDFSRDGPALAAARLQTTGLPTQADRERALDQTIRDMVRQDVRAFSAITSRSGIPERERVVRKAEPAREVALGPQPHVDFVDQMVSAMLGGVGRNTSARQATG